MLKPPIVRMGGKSRLRNTIIEMIPNHTCYVELFFGAGWVYFGKEKSKVEVINDIDKELVNLFKMIKYHGPEIERLLEYEFSGRNIFQEYKDYPIHYLTEVHRAIRFLYLINCSFAGKGEHYGYGTTKIPSQKIYNKATLADIKDRLKNTYVENLDFQEVIKKYDRENSFFFIDPPYYETSGYSNEFTEEDHIRLKEQLTNLKGKFLLTINDHKSTREWYKDVNIKEVEVFYSVSKINKDKQINKELIITNY